MATIKRKYEPVIIKKRMTEFHAKPRNKSLKERLLSAGKKVHAAATSERAKEGRAHMRDTAIKFGSGIMKIGHEIAENRARMEREATRRPRKRKTTKKKR